MARPGLPGKPAGGSASPERDTTPTPTPEEKLEVERQEEAKLKQKFPNMAKPGLPGKPAGGPGGQSSFLQKRMAKNAKYFDSGDYQMDQQKAKGRPGVAGLKLGGAPPQGQAG